MPQKARRNVIPASLLLFLFIALTACGSSDDSGSRIDAFAKITPTERIFAIEDFKAVRFKTSKEYDVSELPSATSAWFGFWTPSGADAKEYEIRFYSSHADAKEFGTAYAIEGAGETALLEEEDAMWDVGIKDRRAFFAGRVGTHGSGSVQPLYGGYAIYGNMVMLCEGANEDQALDNCAALVNAVEAQTVE